MRLKVLVVGWALIVGCESSSLIGEDLVNTQNFELSVIDTVSLNLSTVQFDSLVTSTSERILIGTQSNSMVGDVSTEAYFLCYYDPAFAYSVDESIVFDSLVLSLPMDGYHRSLQEVGYSGTLVLERLDRELEWEDDGYLYNFSTVATFGENSKLAEKTFFFDPERIRTLEMRLNDSFGLDLFEKLKEGDEIYSSTSEFYEYLKGFHLHFDNSDTPFIGFSSDSIRLTIHGTDYSVSPPDNYIYDFGVTGSPYFTKIEHTNIPEGLDQIETIEDEISSEDTDHMAFIHGGIGYAAKLDLKSIRNLLLDDDDFLIGGAELRFKWPSLDEDDLPSTLKADYVDEYFNNLADQSFYFTLNLDDEFGRDSYYSLDISPLINALLEPLTTNEYSLLITLDDFSTSATSVVLGDERFDSELILYTVNNLENE